MERSREDVVAGILRIAVGGSERPIQTLNLRESRTWLVLACSKIAGFRGLINGDDSIESLSEFADTSLDTILDVVVAYDKQSMLGGRDWLEEHADPTQLYLAARDMGEVSLPFVHDVRSFLAVFPTLFKQEPDPDDASASTRYTNGHSPRGASTRGRLKTVSTGRS